VTAEYGKLKIVNELSLEAYLGGVVPAEMPSSFPPEALKAQAVAARSFAMCRMNGAGDRDWDVTDGDGSQVYRGVSAERPASNQAILATCGQVLACGGETCDTTYSCDCGGHTAAAEEMGFGAKKSYLPGTDDGDFCKGAPNHEWRLEWSADKWQAMLKALGKDVGTVTGVSVTKVGPSGRAQMVHIEGDEGSADVRGTSIRKAGGYDVVRSTRFKVDPFDGGWALVGTGWGHGVGLCQWGAGGRAKAGQTYEQILSAYFPGATLKTLSQ
jgi:stage II sporulation protein D